MQQGRKKALQTTTTFLINIFLSGRGKKDITQMGESEKKEQTQWH